jgi:hypothetical protein
MRARRKINTLVLLLLLIASFVYSGVHLSKAESESSETLDVSVNILSSNSEITLAKNVEINSSGTIDLPIDYSIEAFNDHFKSAKYALIPNGRNFLVYLIVTYDAIDVNKAENYTDDVLEQFLGAFNLNLNVIDKSHFIDNATNAVMVGRKLGYVERQIEPVEEFLKYKGSGFGDLIDREFLSTYVPGDPFTGPYSIEYTLESVKGVFSWRLSSEFDQRLTVEGENVDINLSEIFHAPIETSAKTSEIFIEFYRNPVPGITMNLADSSPNYTSTSEEEGVVTVTYDWTSINSTNLVLQLGVQKNTSDENIVKLAVIAVAISILSIAIIVVAKKRKKHLHSRTFESNS